jgi:hypothetical protein
VATRHVAGTPTTTRNTSVKKYKPVKKIDSTSLAQGGFQNLQIKVTS